MRRDRPDIDDEAAIWVARMDAGGWTAASEADLQDWVALDPRNKGALFAAQAAWLTLGEREMAELEQQADNDDTTVPLLRRRSFMAGIAAALAASLVGGMIWLVGSETYATNLGEIRRVPLADGSIAAINTASVVRVRLAATRRDVNLERGEAWFQVAKDAKRPFLVEAGRIRVRAVGTAFAVRRIEGGAEVLVTEGIVTAWTDGAEGNRIRLTAGQRAFIADNAGVRKELATPSAVDRDLAWRSGKIDLLGKPLIGAIAEFNRYNSRKLVLADRSLEAEQLTGVFGTDDPEGFAATVRDVFDVPVEIRDEEIRIGSPRN
jgi:transmembrane sensor